MPDITMCANKKCPSRNDCYRYRAIPSPYRQSYFADIEPDAKTGKCDEFWPILGRTESSLMPIKKEKVTKESE